MSLDVISLDGVEYVKKESLNTMCAAVDGLRYCLVRTYSAGVFAGYVDYDNVKKEMTVKIARRIWYWSGAASLSQLSEDGTSNPSDCKFPKEVSEIKLTEVVEVLPCTEKAQKSIAEVAIWSM